MVTNFGNNFWCEWCEKEFASNNDAQKHEKTCTRSQGMASMFDNFDKDFYGEVTEAKKREKYLDYSKAIEIYEKIGMPEEARRVRKIMAEQKKVDQTVVHGDYVDDRDTIVKDSVINKSNIGSGGKSKAEEIKEIKELLDSGAIDKDDYEKMKREIIG